jgi:hypothetical protein
MDSGYSLSDISAVAKDGGMFGGNGGGIWIFALIILLIISGGGLFGGNRGGDIGSYATAASQQEILFGQQFQGLDNKIDRLGNGICDSTYALNNSINAVTQTVGGMVTTEGRAMQTQLANCCCENQRNVDTLRYEMANMACGINSNIDSKFAALEKAQFEQTIANQAQQINQLYLAQQMAGVVRFPMSSTWNMGSNPFCGGCCNAM